MNSDIANYQKDRIDDIQNWCATYYQNFPNYEMEIRFIILWTVFNALYNVLDYPNRKVINVLEDIPIIRGSNEYEKLKNIAAVLTDESTLIQLIISNYFDTLHWFSTRRPTVQQPKEIQSISYSWNNQNSIFDLEDIKGIGSTDRRVILPKREGIIFEYRLLDIELDDNRNPKNPNRFTEQLIFYLYQIRNNIVHGGSATFGMQKKELASQSNEILEKIIDHLFSHKELLLSK